jgi:signal transduction histidine kinase
MKFLLLSMGCSVMMATPTLAQITHVMTFQSGSTGRQQTEINLSQRNEEQEIGLAVSTDTNLTSTQTVDAQSGKTETYQYETQATSIAIETGERTEIINAHFYEGYDYSESGVLHDVNFEF